MLALAAPDVATAQAFVSQATGRLVTTSLLSSATLDSLASLRGANAVNTGATGDVVVNTPVDAAAAGGLLSLRTGPSNIHVFGADGVVQLSAVGQYARANDNGSSVAFAGSAGAAPGLIGVDTVSTGPGLGSPTAGSGAEVKVATTDLFAGPNLVAIDANFEVLAASAQQDTAVRQTGQYRVGDVSIAVGGTLVASPKAALGAIVNDLQTTLIASGVTSVVNPFASNKTLTLSSDDLEAAGLGIDLNALPPDTDILAVVARATTTKITALTLTVFDQATAALPTVPAVFQPNVQAAITVAEIQAAAIVPVLPTILQPQLATALSALAQLVVNHKETVNGAFTQTALRVGLGAAGAVAKVDLASASVGPNAGPSVVTTPPPLSTTATTPTPATAGTTGSGSAGVNGGDKAGGTSGTNRALASTGTPLESELVPGGTIALLLLAGGLVGLSVRARRARTHRAG